MQSSTGIEARGLVMSFGGALALNTVDFDLRPGEIHAITGENGAGKSTLAKIIAGVYRPTGGSLTLNGLPVSFRNPQDALRHGVALVHQEPVTFPDLSVEESIFAGNLQRTGLGTVDWRGMRAQTQTILNRVGLKQKPQTMTRELSVADQQLIELASALVHGAKVIILDETTASLTPSETAHLFAIVRTLRDEGCAIGFVSHKLDEVFSVCDRITVLRDGKLVGELETFRSSPSEVVRLMVGRDVELTRSVVDRQAGEVRLAASGVRVGRHSPAIDFSLRGGEIAVIAGLVGAGRTEFIETLCGITKPSSGTIEVHGKSVAFSNPFEAMDAGIALVPEDRRQHGLLMPWSIADNASLPILSRLSHLWLQDKRAANDMAGWIEQLRIACRGPMQPVQQLSGGNQQKVVIAKALATEPKILIVDEPTRGVDVGAKAEVHRLLRKLADEGIAVLAVSSDLTEVLELADRVVVMREGAVAGELKRDDATQERIMALATGQREPSAKA